MTAFDALSVTCPVCGARPGRPCGYRRASNNHAGRIVLASRAAFEADPWRALGMHPPCPGCGAAHGDPCEDSCRTKLDGRLVSVDGEPPCTLQELFEASPSLPPEDVARLEALEVGETCEVGGGAGATFEIRRVS